LKKVEANQMDEKLWVGKDEHFGVPSKERPDSPEAASWDLEAIAAVERPHDAVVSPDGENVAFVLDRDTSDIWIVPAAGGAPTRISAGRKLAAFWEDDSPAWSPDGSRLAYSSDGSVWVVPVGGGLPEEVGEGSSPHWITDDELIMTMEVDEKSRLVRTGVEDAWPRPVSGPEQNAVGARVFPEHAKLLFTDYPPSDRNSCNVWIHDLGSGKSKQLTDEPGMHDTGACLSPDGQTVAFVSERSGWYEIYLVDQGGTDLRALTDASAGFSDLSWHPSGDRILAVRSKGGVDDLVFVDVSNGEVSIVAKGGQWSSPGWSSEGPVAVHESWDTPPRLVNVTRDGEVTALLEAVPASIKAARYTEPEEVAYQAPDGTEIRGFLFRPAGDGPFPAVVYPHGGPTSVYGDEWDGHAQYFVDKGYGWFAINFRGSTGYGRDFERANHGVWGVEDTNDCLAAADFLSGLDWVDSDRIGIFGASYGSYMALASLALDADHRFACGVAKYGDSDIATSWAEGDRGGREDLERMMGTPAENRAAYRAGSPLWRVEDIERPILVAHGELDLRVPPAQSEQLVDALRLHQKTFEYVTYPTEGHGLLRSGPQVHFYRRLERFLDWYLM
jgi:dipeptidyl aminopeptidase/acylaminoacyl peptidase